MSDLVQRLRNKDFLWTVPGALREEAADRIEALEEECQLLSKRHQEADVALAGYETRIEGLEAALRLGVTMRAQQILYFKNKHREQLVASKAAEKAFDEAARRAPARSGGQNMTWWIWLLLGTVLGAAGLYAIFMYSIWQWWTHR